MSSMTISRIRDERTSRTSLVGLVARRVRRSLSRLGLGSRAPARPLHHIIRTHTVIVSRDGSRCHATCSRLTTRSRVHHPLLRLWSIPLIKPYPHPHHIDRTPHGPCAAPHNPARPSQYPHTHSLLNIRTHAWHTAHPGCRPIARLEYMLRQARPNRGRVYTPSHHVGVDES